MAEVFLFEFGSQGSAPGQFEGPSAITVDAAGNIYLVDSGNLRIQKFDSSGDFLLQIPFAVFAPAGVAVDSNGNIYVADQEDSSVRKFSNDGYTRLCHQQPADRAVTSTW